MQEFAWKGSRRLILRVLAAQPVIIGLADLGLFASTAKAAEARMRVMQSITTVRRTFSIPLTWNSRNLERVKC